VGREKPGDYFLSFQGAHKTMVYEHIPWGVVLDENVSLDSLKPFPVVVLPHADIVSEREAALFRSYVESGGKLIVTGLSGCYDHLGRIRTNSALETLTGGRFVRKLDSMDNWVRFNEPVEAFKGSGVGTAPPHAFPSTLQALHGSTQTNWPFLVKGPAGVFEPTTALAVGELLKPHRTTRQQEGREGTEWPMSADRPVGPAILMNHVGKGTVLTFTCSPDFATASEHHVVEARKLLADAVRFLLPRPRIRIEAPATVEAVVTDDPATRTLRVHLIGYNAPPQTTSPKERPYVLPAMIEDVPIFRARIELDRPPKRVEAFHKSTLLKRQGARVEATVSDIHEVLQVRY
jgi:hypothetical protein